MTAPAGTGTKSALVLGGGFAGLTAAVELAERGLAVTVLERRPTLGGRASSFTDRQTGQRFDNGQHLFIGGYVNSIAFLRKIGAERDLVLDDDLEVLFIARDGRRFPFRASRLPAPFHLVGALLRHPLLSARDRAAAARVALAALRMSERELEATEPDTFERFLARFGRQNGAVDAFWEVLALATVNNSVRSISAYPLLKVLRLGFLTARASSRLGYARVGLGDLYTERAQAFLEARGGRVRVRARVAAIEVSDGGVAAVTLEGGERLEADLYVSALPFGALRPLRPDLVPAALVPAPILNAHVVFDRPVMEATFAALVGARLAQWVWNRSRMLGRGAGELSVTVSGANETLRLPREEVERLILDDLRDFLPEARAATVRRCVVVKEPAATLACTPGVERLRPPAPTSYPNLFLAGDRTAPGLPSPIAGAVISGLRAVEAALGLGPGALVRPLDATPDWPVRLVRRIAQFRS